ncbi:hypothetical protein [Larkinella sp.]|uniref:hypothetical protein n=1 Tax=Larkinella sp. TaxID=2034517 RepID=UPI003BACCF71
MRKQPITASVPGGSMRLTADKDAPIPTLDGKVKYQVFGDGILRDTWVYFYPHQLAAKIEKYRGLKQWLFGPIREESAYSVNQTKFKN